MNQYYILKVNIKKSDYFGHNGDLSNDKIIKLSKEGVSLTNYDIDISLYDSKGELRDYIDNCFSIPIVSERLADIFKSYTKSELEFYEVSMNRKNIGKYYFINILNMIDAIDYENSVYEEYLPGSKVFRGIEKLLLYDKSINHLNIFRLTGFNLRIVISEQIKNEISKLNIDEIEIIPVNEYKWKNGDFKW